LFDDRRVQLPILDYSKNESSETNRSGKGRQDKESLTPDVPCSIDQSCLLGSNISEVVRRYSTATSIPTDVPLSVDAHPNMSMPVGTEIGAQIASTHRHQMKFQSSELFPAPVMTDAVSTQVSAPCSQTSRHYQFVAKQPYPLPQEYSQNILHPGCSTQNPTEGANFTANQKYPLSSGYLHSGLLTSGYATQTSTLKGRSRLNPTTYDHLYTDLSLSNPQSNYEGHCDICFNQGRSSAHNNDIYKCERQRFSEGTPANLSLQCIPTYPEDIERNGKTVPVIDQKRNSADYIQIPVCDKDFETDQMRYGGPRSNASDSSDLENDVDPRHTQQFIRAESNTKDRCSPLQKSVFSRLSLNKQLTCQEAAGPTLNQLVSSLSQKTEQWSYRNKSIGDGLVIPLIGEEAMDYSRAELNLPSQLELQEEEESIEPQVPLYNFKRRSEARNVDANLGKEISGKTKRRKLVRPSLEETNASSTNVGELESTEDRKQHHLEVTKNQFVIDLNIPAPSADSDPGEEDHRIAVCPSVINAPLKIDANKPNTDVMESTKAQDLSSASAQKISIDFNVAELNSMDESKLQTILDQASLLLQALGQIKSGKPDNSEEARSSNCSEDRKVNMAVNSDGGHQI
jgi:hypothetical protein